jgi:hypothetical protein
MRYVNITTAVWMTLLCVLATGTHAQDAGITLLPPRVDLSGAKATQSLVVERLQNGRHVGDLTARAVFSTSDPKVALVTKDGVVRPVGDGTAVITAAVGGQKAVTSVQVTGTRKPFAWTFRNHVLPVFTKASCNSGACHGALAGKGGLKLTLRGFDPGSDHEALTRQAAGRRVVAGDPGSSLALLKPTMTVGHGGGERIKKGSVDYSVLSEWIKAGAPRPKPTDPTLQRLEVFPTVTTLKSGDKQQILVRALYSDGHAEDVTRWVKFGTSDGNVATVDDQGAVKVMGSGEAAITVWFSSKVTFARVVSPFPNAPSSDTFGKAARSNFIDEHVVNKLESLGIPPSAACTDAEFVRRAYLDAAGILPTVREVNEFVADSAPDKRTQLIESLLDRPEFVDYWTYKWSDLLLVSSRKLSGTALTSFYNWIRKSVEENKPWDRFAREILTAKGSNLDNGAANYYILHKEPIDLMETTTQAFLGMSLMCARCHNHPLEKWTQRDYYQMANLLSRVRLKNGDRAGEVLALASLEGDINHPRLGTPLPPRPLEAQEIALEDTRDRREALANWLTAPDNPYFAKAVVNRVWRNFMGRGLVEAEDDLRLTNPPSNQELLDALAHDFAKNGYDVKRLIRLIMTSAAYQRSAEPVGNGVKDDRYYSRYIVRRLPAEVLLDALSRVTGVPTEFAGYPKGTRALQLRDSQIASYFLTAFGRPERAQTCSCERQQEPSVAQALHLANGDTVNAKLRAPGSIVGQLVKDDASDEEVVKELFLSALSRLPTPTERAKLLPILAETPLDPLASSAAKEARRQALEDLYWAVLTDKEFLFNH